MLPAENGENGDWIGSINIAFVIKDRMGKS